MGYTLRKDQFCSISRNIKWQEWLYSVAPDLCEELKIHLKNSRSCKSNREKMIEINDKLVNRGLNSVLISFLSKNMPYIIKKTEDEHTTNRSIIISRYDDVANNDGVFLSYNANILQFPQKVIIENKDSRQLLIDIKKFLKDKIGFDYIIIGNRAYIEYFKLKYDKESKLISRESREIFQYRIKHNIK